MENMEVEVVSRETIRPSSPTPPQLRSLKFSLLDQLSPPYYTPIILYYPISDGNPKISQVVSRLKDSLSETLSRFYPLAGRIKDHLWMDCNDEGVLFLEAKVNCQMSKLLKEPKIESLHQLSPCQEISFLPPDAVVQVAVQLNIFACGGIAISVCFFHRTVDAATMSAFLKSWAEFAKGSCDKVPDCTTGSELFPPRESLWDDKSLLKPSWLIRHGKGVRRRFVFDAAAVSALRTKARSELVPNPSRVETVSSFIWKRAMTASRVAWGLQQPQSSLVTFAVDMRPRMVPPLSEYCTGNMVWQATTTAPAKEDARLQDLVNQLRKYLAKINHEFLEELKGDEGVWMISKFREEVEQIFAREKPDVYMFTSWCNFGFNKVDFGWGKPAWVSSIGGDVDPVFANVFILMDTSQGDGIEAWLTLDELEMAVLGRDPEFLAFAAFNPSAPIPERLTE